MKEGKVICMKVPTHYTSINTHLGVEQVCCDGLESLPMSLCIQHGNQINIINFSLAKKFQDPNTHLHIPYMENKSLTETRCYTSINIHFGVEHAHCGDLVPGLCLNVFLAWFS
jgi:hypothetical protein